MTKISFVIPCYHSQNSIGHVVQDISRTIEQRGGYDYEIILVNDNPPDETWNVISELMQRDPHVRGICFSRNFGQHSALMAGYRHVTGDIVVSLDDDGQNPPSEMFKLIDAIDASTDLVYANYQQKKHSMFRNFGSMVNDRMVCWLLDKPKELYLASYYAAKRFVIDDMVRCESPFPYIDGLALRTTSCYINVDVDHLEREQGSSGYTLIKLLKLWVNGLTSFSVKPLRIATILGCCAAALGIVMGLVLVIQKLILGDQIDAGWTSLMAMFLLLDGTMMMMLGLIGEYVGRIYVAQNKSPQYVIKYDCSADIPKKENEHGQSA